MTTRRSRPRLARISDVEERLVARSLRDLGRLWNTADGVVASYAEVSDAVERTSLPLNSGDDLRRGVATNFFFRYAGRSCALEFLDLARRHWPEALMKRRRTFELVAFARLVWQEPVMAEVWLTARRDWQRYREAFKNSRIGGALNELDPKLKAEHERLSGRVHPSMHGLAFSLQESLMRQGRLHRIETFDTGGLSHPRLRRAEAASWFLNSFLWHATLLEAFVRRTFNRKPWTRARRATEPMLGDLVQRMREDEALWADRLKELRGFRETRREKLLAAEDYGLPPATDRTGGEPGSG